MIYLYLAICFVVGYCFGNINFARIFTRKLKNQDITEIGSKNPGAMNMLRTQGLGQALLTLAFEALKVGLPALCCFFIFKTYLAGSENLAYFVCAFGGILGHCFPALYHFKGGKGVACSFGMFLFHPLFWWVSLVAFVICFLLFFAIKYGFIITLTCISGLTIYATVIFSLQRTEFWIPILVILWLNLVLVFIFHRKNFQRFFAGQESKIDLADKVRKMFKRKTKTESEQGADGVEAEQADKQQHEEKQVVSNVQDEKSLKKDESGKKLQEKQADEGEVEQNSHKKGQK